MTTYEAINSRAVCASPPEDGTSVIADCIASHCGKTNITTERERPSQDHGGRVRSTCEATTVDPSRSLQLIGGAVEPGPHPPTPRTMAAAQAVRQPIRRVVSFGSLTFGGCVTPERPQMPVGESHGASGVHWDRAPRVFVPAVGPGADQVQCRSRSGG